MRSILLIALSVLVFHFEIVAQVYGTPIMTWDFANGLPTNWQTGITSVNNIAQWEYRGPNTTPNTNVGARGSCAGTAYPINSVTKANGFMIFDSNYWDDGDMVCGGLGSGVDPAPHNAWLMTNSVNLSSYPSVVLTFQQQYKHYQTTVTKVELSVNGGSWIEVLSNTEAAQSPTTEWKTVNISAHAGGQSDVRLRFSFVGVYYWWLLDDITIYTPYNNDVMLNWSGYTTNPFGVGVTPYSDLQYDQYPSVMIPAFSFRGRGTNVGANQQTNVRLNTRVVRNGTTEVYNSNSVSQTLASNTAATMILTPTYTTPATIGNYKIYYDILQSESDENPSNDRDSLDYSIAAYTYARDEGPMVDSYGSTDIYTQWPYEIGNMFQIRTAGKICNSMQVAIAAGTQPGAQIRGIIYAENMETVVAQTNIYTVNIADLNSVGQEKIVTLHFPSSVALTNGAYYMVMVSQLNASQVVKIARSGTSPSETSFVRYLSVNGNFYSPVTPIVRMNIFNSGVISGCNDPTAMNYVSANVVNDGSCRYPGCTNVTASNYNVNANFDNGTCLITGCMNPEADNYNPAATADDGSCLILGCMNPDAENYDPDATEEDGSCIIQGCMNPEADNYNIEATLDDGSCVISGCMDSAADNYNPNANQSDGSCIYFGCTDIEADNFNPFANTNDGSCIYSGCMNSAATNYNPQANIDDGSCIILGCIDEAATNYDPEANEDDGSCTYSGCMDETAVNYSAVATVDDGSCMYLEISMSVSVSQGCSPLSVTVTNNTAIVEEAICTFRINDQVIQADCVSSFIHVFDLPGVYELTYVYQVGDSTSDSTVIITVVPSPQIPLIEYDDQSYDVICTNCSGNYIIWFYNSNEVQDSTETSMGIYHDDAYHSGFYNVQVTNDSQCSMVSEDLFVLQPFFELSEIQGCAPFVLNIVNQTSAIDNVSFNLDFGDGNHDDDFETETNHTYISNNNYSITLTATTPLGEGTYSKTVSVYPVIEPILVHEPNDGLVVCQNADLFASMVWNIDGVIFNDFGPHSDGSNNYIVTGTTAFGCVETAVLIPTQVSKSRTDNITIDVYPNPAKDYCIIQNNDQGTYELEVYNSMGERVYSAQIDNNHYRYDVSSLSSGVYLMKFILGNSRVTRRLSIVR